MALLFALAGVVLAGAALARAALTAAVLVFLAVAGSLFGNRLFITDKKNARIFTVTPVISAINTVSLSSNSKPKMLSAPLRNNNINNTADQAQTN